MRLCKACAEEKPLTDFYGPYINPRTRHQKWGTTCKACLSERKPVQSTGPSKRDLAREQRLRDYPGSKTCTGCGEEKPLADFGRPVPKDRAGGRQQLAFSPRCLACQSKAVAERRARKAGARA